jgi:hypothetical protein
MSSTLCCYLLAYRASPVGVNGARRGDVGMSEVNGKRAG